jgi:hypothetical protein
MSKQGEYIRTTCPICRKKFVKHPDSTDRETVYICENENCGYERRVFK